MFAADLAEYPFKPRFIDINGHKLAYLDEGEGPVIVMLHGNPSWWPLSGKGTAVSCRITWGAVIQTNRGVIVIG